MKKTFLVLVLVFALFGCNDSSSSLPTGPTTPVFKTKLTFLENSTPYSAIIFKDGVPLESRSTSFEYGVENLTNATYNNVSFTIEPSDPTKYSLSYSCTSMAYNTGCLIYVHVNTKTADEVKFSIKMNSDLGEQTFAAKPITANYRVQPSENALSIASGTSKTFLVSNPMIYNTTIKGDVLFVLDSIKIPTAPEHKFTTGNVGFKIVDTNVPKTLTIDGTKQNVRNCFAKDLTISIPNAGVNACYVEVSYTNSGTSPQSDTLEISSKVSAGRENVWKPATIALTGTN